MGKSDITGHKEAGRAKLLAQGLNAVIDEITGRKPPHPINPSTRNNDIYSSGGGRRKMITSKFLTDLGFKQQAEDRHEYRLCFATGHYLQVDIDTGLIFLIEYSDNQAVQMDRLNTDDIKLLVETFTKIWGTKWKFPKNHASIAVIHSLQTCSTSMKNNAKKCQT